MNDAKLAEYTKSRLLNASVVVGYLRSLIAATNELEIEVIYIFMRFLGKRGTVSYQDYLMLPLYLFFPVLLPDVCRWQGNTRMHR